MGLAAKSVSGAADDVGLQLSFLNAGHKIPCKISLGLAERSTVPMGRRTYGGSFQALRARLVRRGTRITQMKVLHC
jgi:hypothetical protein